MRLGPGLRNIPAVAMGGGSPRSGSIVGSRFPRTSELSRVQVQGNANLLQESAHTLSPDLKKGLSSSHVGSAGMVQQPRGPLLTEPGSYFSVELQNPPTEVSLVHFLPSSPTPSSPLCLLTRQAYPAPFIFRISKCSNKTFVLCCCAHDWETRITKTVILMT